MNGPIGENVGAAAHFTAEGAWASEVQAVLTEIGSGSWKWFSRDR